MTRLKIGGATLNQTPLDWENNLNNIKQAINQAIEQQVDVLCLPELCITGYGCEDMFLSDWVADKALLQLKTIQQWCTDIVVAVGLPMRFEGVLYDCTCLLNNQEILGFSAKQNLANDGVHYEPRWFTPWEAGRVETIKVGKQKYPFGDLIYLAKNIKIGFEICEDAWSGKKRPSRQLNKRKVHLILNPSASHFAFDKAADREALMLAAKAPSYIYCNLLGNEAGKMIYDGQVFITQGDQVIRRNELLSFENVNLTTANIDFKNPENSDAPAAPVSLSKNEEFVKALSLALFDYMRKSRSNGFVLSLSGGADSSTCAVMVGEMVKRGVTELGWKKFLNKSNIKLDDEALEDALREENPPIKYLTKHLLTCVYQSSDNSSYQTLNSAKLLAQDLGATFHHWSIKEDVTSYSKKIEYIINQTLSWHKHDIALQNIQARARSPIIWMLTNIKGALLIATSNRSEGSVGYTTMDGDTSGSISPIAGVDKQFIREWLRWAETGLGYQELKHVNGLQPTAELRPKDDENNQPQTDEKDLMPYEVLQAIERLALHERQSPQQIFTTLQSQVVEDEALLKEHIRKFFQLWSRNQWKRERFAPSFHLDDYSIDPRGWFRFPILSGGFRDELEEL
ncbi:NAD(+) synthase [marine bacterium AO1-C]|nr:NAD(+) synthase [marine bacterium AO1-C]